VTTRIQLTRRDERELDELAAILTFACRRPVLRPEAMRYALRMALSEARERVREELLIQLVKRVVVV